MTPTFQRNALTPSSGWWGTEVDAEAIIFDSHFYVHLDIILPLWKWRPHVPSKCQRQTAIHTVSKPRDCLLCQICNRLLTKWITTLSFCSLREIDIFIYTFKWSGLYFACMRFSSAAGYSNDNTSDFIQS